MKGCNWMLCGVRAFLSKVFQFSYNILKMISFKHCYACIGMSCNYLNFMWPKIFVPLDFFFCHKLQHRNSTSDCCQSSSTGVPSENCTNFNIYWNVIKTAQGDTRQSMLFRLCAAEASLPAYCYNCLSSCHSTSSLCREDGGGTPPRFLPQRKGFI